MSMINSYLEQLNESTKGLKKPGSLEGADKNATIEPLEAIDGVVKPETPELNQGITTNEEGVKNNPMSKDNIFERLYRQAINEDLGEMPAGSDEFGGDVGGDMGGDATGSDFDGAEDNEFDSDPGHVGKVKEVVELLQQALDLLQNFEGEEEEEYEEYGDEEDGDEDFGFGGDDSGDDQPLAEEEVQFGQAKTIGHALVNREKFIKGQDKKSHMAVKNATNSKVSKKKASAEYGKGINGKPSNFSDAGGKKMQGKGNMKVASRATSNLGKFAFED